MDSLSRYLLAGLSFTRHAIGSIQRPYETYRELVTKPNVRELPYIALLCFGYVGLATLIRIPEFRFHLLTKQSVLLSLGALGGYLLTIVVIALVGRAWKAKLDLKAIAVCWGYTLLATVAWFLITSVLFVLFPPPRTGSIKGISFSFLYLVFSSVLFFWKIELYYLTLRFTLRLDMSKIIMSSFVIFPVLAIYALAMYKIGIYKVPFL